MKSRENSQKLIKSSLNLNESEELKKAVARELELPDTEKAAARLQELLKDNDEDTSNN